MEKQIYTDIEINAPAEQVWQCLTNFADFAKWNPFIRKITGEAKVGAKLELVQTTVEDSLAFCATILKAEPHRELRWLEYMTIPKLLDGEHAFIIEPIAADHVRLIHSDVFSGLLLRFFAKGLTTNTHQSFELMNQALKLQIEQPLHS